VIVHEREGIKIFRAVRCDRHGEAREGDAEVVLPWASGGGIAARGDRILLMFKKTEVKVVRPPSMELVIRRPRMTKAFEFQEEEGENRTLERKQIVERKPTADIQTKSVSTMDLMGTVASFEYATDMKTDMDAEVYVLTVSRFRWPRLVSLKSRYR